DRQLVLRPDVPVVLVVDRQAVEVGAPDEGREPMRLSVIESPHVDDVRMLADMVLEDLLAARNRSAPTGATTVRLRPVCGSTSLNEVVSLAMRSGSDVT